MNENLAEICGIIAGDGHLSRYLSKKRTDYKVSIFGHKEDDKDYLMEVQYLIEKTIGIKPKFLSKKNHIEIRINSKNILELFEDFGIPVGRKSGSISIPKEIKNDFRLSTAFIRGLSDTDFSVVFKRRKTKKTYPRITADIKSKLLIEDVCHVLNQLEIKYCGPYCRNRERSGSKYKSYQIDINGHENFDKWMKNIGFRNSKHLKKIKREFGKNAYQIPSSPPTRI